MSAAPRLGLLLWCFLFIPGRGVLVSAGDELPAPHNPNMVTLNTNYTLTWDWDQSAAGSHNVTFTAEYIHEFRLKHFKRASWSKACENTRHRSCDLTGLGLHYLAIYMLRVRANLNGRHSDWVQKPFLPDKDAALGPPSQVAVSPAGSVLDVSISDPLTSSNSSMRDITPDLYYRIVYWEVPAHLQEWLQAPLKHRPLLVPSQNVQELNVTINLVTLPNLKAWTWYCISVQSRTDSYNKNSSFTVPLCRQTQGTTPWWLIFSCFLGSLLLFFMVVLLVVFGVYGTYRTLKKTLFPSEQLPRHLYLCGSPSSDVPRLVSPDSESELLSDMLVVCQEPDPPEEAQPALPAGLEGDSSGRHSRQDSSGSRDSGVYSTGGGSSLRQPSGDRTSQQGGSCDPEQLKMSDIAPELGGVATDEGIGDVSV